MKIALIKWTAPLCLLNVVLAHAMTLVCPSLGRSVARVSKRWAIWATNELDTARGKKS